MKISETIYLKSITENDIKDLRTLMDRIYHPAYINYWKDKGDWYVSGLYNEENLHRELQENEAMGKGYKKLWLEVMEKQHQAVHFYKKLDFTEVDKVIVDFPLLYDNYRGMYKMVKELKD